MNAIEMQKQMQQLIARGASPQEMADFAEGIAEASYADSRRTALVGTAIGAALCVMFSVGTLAGALSALLSNGGSSASLSTAAGLGLTALVLGAFGAVLTRNAFALRPPPKELVTTGVPARIVVRDYRQAPGGFQLRTGGQGGPSVSFQRVALDLDVTPAEGAPYQVTVREYLAMRAFVKLAQGAKLSGYVDRAKPDRIFIDWRARG